MKSFLLIVVTILSVASAFAPVVHKRSVQVSTELCAKEKTEKKKSIFGIISDLDLFAPKATQNDYSARGKKNLAVGKINQGSSYVPSGMSAAEYNNIRKKAADKKAANYQKNVAKAGIFIDYTDWYKKRGTDTGDGWQKSVTRGHTMAKTKYDWNNFENNAFASGASSKKSVPKKAAKPAAKSTTKFGASKRFG